MTMMCLAWWSDGSTVPPGGWVSHQLPLLGPHSLLLPHISTSSQVSTLSRSWMQKSLCLCRIVHTTVLRVCGHSLWTCVSARFKKIPWFWLRFHWRHKRCVNVRLCGLIYVDLYSYSNTSFCLLVLQHYLLRVCASIVHVWGLSTSSVLVKLSCTEDLF